MLFWSEKVKKHPSCTADSLAAVPIEQILSQTDIFYIFTEASKIEDVDRHCVYVHIVFTSDTAAKYGKHLSWYSATAALIGTSKRHLT